MLEGPTQSLRSGLKPDILSIIDRWKELNYEEKLRVWRELEIWNILDPKEGKSSYPPVAVIRPEAGTLLIFNGRDQVHAVRSFEPSSPDRVRLTVPANYYTNAVPEVPDPEFNKQIGVGK